MVIKQRINFLKIVDNAGFVDRIQQQSKNKFIGFITLTAMPSRKFGVITS
jgi:hypothetical protein